MQQINFLIIFVVCLALLLFGIQNAELVVIRVANGIELSAPLSVVLLISIGIGAILAWVFNMWSRMQLRLNLWSSNREVRQRDLHIQKLEEDLERYRIELEAQLLPPSEAEDGEQEAEIEEAEITS